jgi:hypothetical protein
VEANEVVVKSRCRTWLRTSAGTDVVSPEAVPVMRMDSGALFSIKGSITTHGYPTVSRCRAFSVSVVQ